MLTTVMGIIFAVAGAVCWVWPGAINWLGLTVSGREIGALFFVGAAVLWLIRPWGAAK